MDLTTLLIVLTVISVFIFDFTNGFHDSADMVATAIASHAMTVKTAIILVSFFTFSGPLVVGLAVADTIGTFVNISNTPLRDAQALTIAALMAAVTYNLITWKFGLPSSSSNSLAGGLVGAGLFVVGETQINWGISALHHGELVGLMRVIIGLFASHQTQTFTIPLWVIFMCATAITLGTMFGDLSIIKTLGFELYHIKLVHSVANQLGAALLNTLATSIGAPTSTTQVVTATLLGNGAAEKPSHVGWKRAAEIILGWFINVPISMFFGALYSYILIKILGVFS